MDKKAFTIGILSLTAVLLFAANLIVPENRASANMIVKDRDYQLMTALYQANDEACFVVDNRSGLMAAFVYSPQQHTLVLRDVRPVMSAFAGGVGNGRGEAAE